MKILVTGAAGNLGWFLTRHLLPGNHDLHLLTHRTELPTPLGEYPNVSIFKADLGEPDSLYPACREVDCIVHFAGVLFAPRPERFLSITNIEYVRNLVNVAQDVDVRKFILISFPHVDGESTPDDPATGRLDGQPSSIHAQTRLAAEQVLFQQTADSQMVPVVLRPGMIYGRGVLMIEAARWLLARRLLGVWQQSPGSICWLSLIFLPAQ